LAHPAYEAALVQRILHQILQETVVQACSYFCPLCLVLFDTDVQLQRFPVSS
jgi:hypothetical protein